mmetsp:Transcript_28519/g.63650  ORF Transcript_28519/g.63650 Transcript_28519/m.63650 type:complete len:992 (-) Transcript_28519:354-3329(-)|eukprot:CAMPEP_0172608836 /NCGR_PEP_ID=MMETSP1068-20121228/28886_1 /TAXON_ID=35684 /ORGANISM="Pseudopedinella elastica, Strain CCMP716" /LENGTH=991 /DNA_ID=CAMNT_0013412213 /DNA_START=71 /DNA_END=3046 /DNA_ORIENTATION=+
MPELVAKCKSRDEHLKHLEENKAQHPAHRDGDSDEDDDDDEPARRLKAALLHRERFLLPRFVPERNAEGKIELKKLEAGEFNPNSHLYPLTMPIRAMSDLGVGVGMYFNTQMFMTALMIICGLLQLPNVYYFGTTAYDPMNKKDRTFHVGGSASCLAEERVCMNSDCTSYAGEFHFPSPNVPRYTDDYVPADYDWRDKNFKIYDDDKTSPNAGELGASLGSFGSAQAGDKMWVGKRKCQLRPGMGSWDTAMMCVICAAMFFLGRLQNKQAEDIDEEEQTAQDYSIVVEDPNPEIVDPDVWKAHFEKVSGGKVFMVTVCLNNGELLRTLKMKRHLETEIQIELSGKIAMPQLLAAAKAKATNIGMLHELEEAAAKKKAKKLKDPSLLKRVLVRLGMEKSLEDYIVKLCKTNLEFSKIVDRKYQACKVYVMFETEEAQRTCLNNMCVGKVPAALDWKDQINKEYLMDGNLLHVAEAPEPESIIYENLQYGTADKTKQQLTNWTILVIALAAAFFTIREAYVQGYPAIGAILISFWNSCLPVLISFLVRHRETPHTTDEMEDSFITKTVTARGFTSSLVLYIVGLQHSTGMLTPYFVGSVQAALFADAITSPIIRFLDLAGTFKRYVMAPLASTDERAKELVQGTDWLLADRYTDLAKSVLMSLCFSAIFPLGYFYSAFACFLSFCVDKYCVLRIFKMKPPADDKLAKITRSFVGLCLVAHCALTAHFYYSWPYDSLCKTSEALSTAGAARAGLLGIDADTVYRVCNQLSPSLLPPVGKEPWFQEGGAQYRLVAFYYVAAFIIMIYVAFFYFGFDAGFSIYSLFYYKHQTVGDISLDTKGNPIKCSSIPEIKGYVPQIEIPGVRHHVMACTAPNTTGELGSRLGKEKSMGGLEFDVYLLDWVASKESTVPGTDEEFKEPEPLTDAEKHQLYTLHNLYVNDQLQKLDKGVLDTVVLSRAKQYIRDFTTIERFASQDLVVLSDEEMKDTGNPLLAI